MHIFNHTYSIVHTCEHALFQSYTRFEWCMAYINIITYMCFSSSYICYSIILLQPRQKSLFELCMYNMPSNNAVIRLTFLEMSFICHMSKNITNLYICRTHMWHVKESRLRLWNMTAQSSCYEKYFRVKSFERKMQNLNVVENCPDTITRSASVINTYWTDTTNIKE